MLPHVVIEHHLLLRGSNDAELEVLDPRPARDYDTELFAVVACDDGILFAIGGDPASPASWTRGAVYALPRAGVIGLSTLGEFRRVNHHLRPAKRERASIP